MARMVVRSRSGNLALTVVGAIYTLSAIAALIAFAVDVRHAAALTDRLLQFGLIASAAVGVWFVLTGLRGMGKDLPHFLHRSS